VSVFLRWGVFGILGFAALLYAYNASKRLAEAHAIKAQAVANAPAPTAAQSASNDSAPAETAAPAEVAVAQPRPDTPQRSAPAHCEAELVIAQRAIEMHKQGEPLDRLLRIQEIAWQEPPERRRRLEAVATRWFNYEGDFKPEALRMVVISDCEQSSPAPAP
jgi:hypothetical protein